MGYALARALNNFEDALNGLPLTARTREIIRALVGEMVGGYDIPSPSAMCAMPRAVRSYRDIAATLYKSYASRDEMLGLGICVNPVWYMLLDLFMAAEDGANVTVTSLCNAASVPATTALRQMGVMEREGLLARKTVNFNQKRVYIEPTDRGTSIVAGVIDRLEQASRQVP